MTLSYETFLGKLVLLPKNFKLIDGKIRGEFKGHEYCPWAALLPVDDTIDVVKKNKNINYVIWAAADKWDNHNTKIRQDLLKACGLPEEQ